MVFVGFLLNQIAKFDLNSQSEQLKNSSERSVYFEFRILMSSRKTLAGTPTQPAFLPTANLVLVLGSSAQLSWTPLPTKNLYLSHIEEKGNSRLGPKFSRIGKIPSTGMAGFYFIWFPVSTK